MKKYFYIIILFAINLFAETALDSILLREKYPERKVESLNVLAEKTLTQSPNKAILYLETNLEILKKIDYPSEEAKTYTLLGDARWLKGENYDALECFRTALHIYEKIGDKKGIASARIKKSKIHNITGNYNMALESAFIAQNISEEINNVELLVDALNNIGMVFRAHENYQSALDYYNKAMEVSKKNNYSKGEAITLNSIGNLYWFNKKYDRALNEYQKALSIHKSISDQSEAVAVVLNNIGNVYRDKKDFKTSSEYYQKSLEMSFALGLQNLTAITLKNIGFAKLSVNQHEVALNYLERSLKLSKESGIKPLEMEVCAAISKIYYQLNNIGFAYQYLQQSVVIKDSLFKEENARKIAELKYSFETRQKEIKIKQLELEQKTDERNFLVIISLLGSMIVVILLNRYFVLRRKNREDIKQKNAIEGLNKQLSLSEKRYRTLFESISDAIVVCDFDSILVYDVNSAACSLYGYEREEFLNLDVNELLTEPFPMEHYQENKVLRLPLRYHRKKSGELFPVEVIASTFRIDEKPFILGSIRDITKRISDEEKLRKSELFFRSVWENSMDGMRIIDESGKIILVNNAFCRLVGKSEVELKGKDFTVIYSDTQKTDFKLSSTTRFKNHTVEPYFERELTLWNGDKIWFALSNSYLQFEDEKPLLLSLFRDITEKKNAEKDLIQSEERFRMLAENTRDILWMVDNEPKFIYLSPAIEQFLGHTVDEFLKLSIDDFLSSESSLFIKNYHKDIIRIFDTSSEVLENLNTKFELEFIKKDNSKVWGEITATVMRDKNNNITGFQGVTRDINDRKINEIKLKKFTEELQISKNLLEAKTSELLGLNAQLVKSEKELKEINDSKDKFFSIVAHDLKSPFLGLIGFSNILVEEFESLPGGKVKEFLQNINRSTKNLYKLIEQLLEWSRLQLGKIPFNPNKLDAYESVLYVLNILRANAVAKEIEIINNIKPNLKILADEQMLNSILENLVSNAIKFTYPGGRIKLEYCLKDNYHEFSVEDNGIGIKETDIEKLFKIDNTFTNEGTANEKGTGLGLIIAKEMVEKHNGYISVESVFSEKTVFYFGIPQKQTTFQVDNSYP